MDSFAFTDKELATIAYYDQQAEVWANSRKKTSEPSFWHDEYLVLNKLQSPQGKILEIGSGSGREALELTQMGYEYVGMDFSKKLLKIAQKTNPSSQFFYSSPYSLPFAPETFDALFSWALLPHVSKERIHLALQSIRETLKKEGIAFFAMREGISEKQELATGRWFSYYSQEEFENILKENGFSIEQKAKKPSRADLVWLTYFVRRT